MSPETVISRSLKQYADQILNALDIRHGPSHMEIKYDPDIGPCLVEVGARCHGGEGSWMPVAQGMLQSLVQLNSMSSYQSYHRMHWLHKGSIDH